jgi:hypothetical protein
MTTRSLLIALAATLAGCGSTAVMNVPPAVDAAIGPAGADLAKAAPPTVSIKAEWMLAAGEERYQCFIVKVVDRPGDLRVRRVVPQVGAAVHHVGVFTDEQKSEKQPTRECKDMGFWGFVYGAGVGTPAMEMPAGTTRVINEGISIILQMHYLNASDKPVKTLSSVDLELAEEGEALQEVGTLIVGTLNLNLPPQKITDVKSTCTKHGKLEHVFAAFPHMHQLGTALAVTAGADGSMPVVTVPKWDFRDQGTALINPPLGIGADLPIQTRCSFNNTTAKTVKFGLNTSDEMCMTVLYFWPASGRSSLDLCTK